MDDIPILIAPNERFEMDDDRWRVVDSFEGLVTLYSDGGKRRPYRWGHLRSLLGSGDARIIKLDPKQTGDKSAPLLRGTLDGYDPAYVDEGRRCRKYCRAVELALAQRNRLRQQELASGATVAADATVKPFKFTLTDDGFEALAKRVARAVERADGDHAMEPAARFCAREALAPSGFVLNDWFSKWKLGGRTLESVIPRHDLKGRHGSRVNEIAKEVMSDFAERYWLQPEKNTVTKVFALVSNEIRNRFLNAGMDPIKAESKIPHERTFRRLVDKIDAYKVERYREDPKQADRKFKLKRKGPTYERPMQAIQIDHTGLPIVMRDPQDNMTLKGATLTRAVDLYSRATVGWYVGIEPPGWAPVQQCLKMTMTSKSWLKRMDNIKNAGLMEAVHGIPFTVFSDRGAEFVSNSQADAAGQLNYRHLAPPPGAPNYRGVIERSFRRAKEEIFAGMPGRLFKDGRRRIEYDAAGNAILDADQLNWVAAKYFCDIELIDWHDGIDDAPIYRWIAGAKKWGVRLAPDINAIVPLLATVVEDRTIQHTGVEFRGLFYGAGSAELQGLINRYGPGGRLFKIKVDAFDIGRIYLLSPDSKHFLPLECTDESWKGRTLHSREVAIYRTARKKEAHERLHNADIDDSYAELMGPSMDAHDKRHARRNSVNRRRTARVRRPHVDPTAYGTETPNVAQTATDNETSVQPSDTSHNRPTTRGNSAFRPNDTVNPSIVPDNATRNGDSSDAANQGGISYVDY